MAVVTTGFFDGVHLGHRKVIETLVSSARERGEEAVVVTFWPHPRTVLQQDARDFRLLSTLEEKKAMITDLGVDRIEVIPFTRAFASFTAAQYLALLKERYGASVMVMGFDNSIGSDRRTVKDMDNVIIVGEIGNDTLSSTKIRNVLRSGDVQQAREMLGYQYGLKGAVVAGNRMGRKLGFPTANLSLYEPLKLVPGNGVYAVDVEVLGSHFKGMTNIGTRPTVGGGALSIETHILDFDEDIYGLPLTVRFRRRVRDEIHFGSVEELKRQLALDALNCKK